jgi:hypothetical protein
MAYARVFGFLVVLIGCSLLCGRSGAADLPAFLSETDRDRLENFAANRSAAIAEAQGGASESFAKELAQDRKTLAGVLAGDAQEIGEADILGAWRCRTLKLGGNLPLVAYPYFQCRIAREQGKLIFQKTSGSQLTKGQLLKAQADGYVYVGATNGNYGEKEQENEVAYLFKVGAKRLRLEFPKPHYESEFNIMELVR